MNRLPTLTERRKRTRIEDELKKGKLLVHLDPRDATVDVPQHLKEQPALGLNFSHQFPFANTTVGPLSISANLSFSGERYLCVVPFNSIFCITQTSTRHQEWFAESLPQELHSWINSSDKAPGAGHSSEGMITESADSETPTAKRTSYIKLVD